jgi:hypothetical protein
LNFAPTLPRPYIKPLFSLFAIRRFKISYQSLDIVFTAQQIDDIGYCFKEKAPYCACADTLASFSYTSPSLSRNDHESNIGNKETVGLDNNKVISTPICVDPNFGLEPVQPQP